MQRDIFTMREVARKLDVRNRVIAPDPPRILTPIERIGMESSAYAAEQAAWWRRRPVQGWTHRP